MQNITYDNLNSKLVEAVPELLPGYETEVRSETWADDDEGPGPHIIFADVLCPYVKSLARSGNESDVLRRIFNFLEQLASQDDADVRNVVGASVCEVLVVDRDIYMHLRGFMGPATERLCREAQPSWWAAQQNEQ